MFKVIRKLNNNAVIALNTKDNIQVIILDKGIGFSLKTDDIFDHTETMSIYTIQNKQTDDISNNVDPLFLEIANDILNEARILFKDKVDGKVLLPLADHIAFAIERINGNMNISNPFANDIKLLFPDEYTIALKGQMIIKEKTGILIPEDEVGYITLHVHSSLSEDLVATSMHLAILVQETISVIEKELNCIIDKYSISYARLLNHIKYMLLRLKTKEHIEIDMQEYVELRFPKSFKVAKVACAYMSEAMKEELPEVETSYLALHIERITNSQKGI